MIVLRSLRNLATLGSVALAVTGLMASFNYAATAERHILGSLEKLTPELVLVTYHETPVSFARVEDDIRELRSVLGERVQLAPVVSGATLLHNLRGVPLLVQRVRTTPDAAALLHLKATPESGLSRGAPNACLLSAYLAPHLSGSLPAQNASLTLQGQNLNIEGLFTCEDRLLGIDWSRGILTFFTPWGYSEPSDTVRLLVRLAGGVGEQTVRDVESTLMRTRNLRQFSVVHFQDLLAQKRKITKAIRMLTETIALIMLLLATIGCMNIFFISVSERTREIGLRRALGATRGEVLRLIMKDCYIFMGLGTLAGLAGGYCATHALMRPLLMVLPEFRDWSFDMHPEAILKTLVFLLGGATCAGLFPALRAAQIDPAVALRE